MKRTLTVTCLLAALSAHLSAELKYTVHMDLKKAEGPGAQSTNPIVAMVGDGLLKQMVPEGGADLLYTIGDKGVRVEFQQAALGQPAGTVSLSLLDGTMIVMSPKDKTYWKANADSIITAMRSSTAPVAVAKPSAEFSTVAGMKCEVVAFSWKMDLPIPPSARASLPPDFPKSLDITGDMCLMKEPFERYAEIAGKSKVPDVLAYMGLDTITKGSIVLRQNIRLGAHELQAVVTKIGEEEAQAGSFDLPTDYKEVPSPVGRR
jgi:hypothetical protein